MRAHNLDGEFLSVSKAFPPIFKCVDPNPYSEFGSGSRKLLNIDLLWIRIHNTDFENEIYLLCVCVNKILYRYFHVQIAWATSPPSPLKSLTS